MSKRYMPSSSFSLGRGRVYVSNYKQKDGTPGYTEDEVAGLTKDQLRNFEVIDITGGRVVEEATAAPGELRTVARICDDCGFEAKSAAGLAAHERSHDSE